MWHCCPADEYGHVEDVLYCLSQLYLFQFLQLLTPFILSPCSVGYAFEDNVSRRSYRGREHTMGENADKVHFIYHIENVTIFHQ